MPRPARRARRLCSFSGKTRPARLGPQITPSAVNCLSRLAARGRNEVLPPLPAGAAECVPRDERLCKVSEYGDRGTWPVAVLLFDLVERIVNARRLLREKR
jgi:hypothetical protein